MVTRIKISELDELVTPVSADKLVVVDVSDTTQGASGTTKYVEFDNMPGASGESNTVSNVGAGTGLIFKQKTGVDLELKSLLAGDGISLTNNTSDITISRNGAITKTAGENVDSGDLCYLKSDGKYWKADASVQATCDTDLLMANATILADATGQFIEFGDFTTSGLTAGSLYYISETTGEITSTAPSTSTSIVRIVGTAESTTILRFKPDVSFVEVA